MPRVFWSSWRVACLASYDDRGRASAIRIAFLGHSSDRATEQTYPRFTPEFVQGDTTAPEGPGAAKPADISAPSNA